MKQTRRLVAIMFTDIVGYTAMMGQDEDYAIKAVSEHRKVLEKAVPGFAGELINFYGDGCLAIFNSVVFALECAIEIQKFLLSGELKVPLRIGIHIGEILYQEQTIYGDGVNLTSRIQSLGQAGTIFISEEIYLKIANNSRFRAKLMGVFLFKNVIRPVKVYALANSGLTVPDPSSITGKIETTGDIELKHEKSIAVLPFEIFSSNDELKYIFNGISDEIRSQLLKIKNLKIISRSSCSTLVRGGYTLSQVGSTLGVQYVLEGRVQTFDEQMKVSAELSETNSNKQLWSLPATNRSINDIFLLQTEVAQKVAEELKILLTEQEKEQLVKPPTTNPEAFMHYQQGLELLHRGSSSVEELTEAEDCFKNAIALDPDFSRAYVGLCEIYLEHIFWGRKKPSLILDKAQKTISKALELDDTNGEFYGALGAIYFYQMKKGQAKRFLKKAIELSPNYLDAYEKLAFISNYEGDSDLALEYFSKVRELDPLSTKYMGDMGLVYYYAHRFEEGIELMSCFLDKHPKDPWLLFIKGYLYSGLQDYEKSIETFLSRSVGTKTNWMLAYNYGQVGRTGEALEILEQHLEKRKKQYVPSLIIAVMYSGIGNKEKALDWLETDYQEGGFGVDFWGLRTDPRFANFRDEPRFQKLLAKIK